MKFNSQHSLSASDRVRLDTRCQRRLAIQTFDISLAFLMNKIRDNSFEQKKERKKKELFWLCVDDKSKVQQVCISRFCLAKVPLSLMNLAQSYLKQANHNFGITFPCEHEAKLP